MKNQAKDNLDGIRGLKDSEAKSLVERMAKHLGFRVHYAKFYTKQKCWLLSVSDDVIVFIEGSRRNKFFTLADFLVQNDSL